MTSENKYVLDFNVGLMVGNYSFLYYILRGAVSQVSQAGRARKRRHEAFGSPPSYSEKESSLLRVCIIMTIGGRKQRHEHMFFTGSCDSAVYIYRAGYTADNNTTLDLHAFQQGLLTGISSFELSR